MYSLNDETVERVAAAMWASRGNAHLWEDTTDTTLKDIYCNLARAAIAELSQQKVEVKPLVWEGCLSGPYEIHVRWDGVADLYCHASLNEDREAELLRGGYLTLVSIDDLKATAQEHHDNYILSSIKT